MAQESWKCDKDETGCEPPEGPVLCANNCGFFGSMTTMNLCSKCYRDVVLSQAKVSSALDQMPLIGNTEASSTASLSLTDRQQQQQQHQQEQQQQQQQEGIAAAAAAAAAAESSSSAAEAMQSAGAAIRTANRCSQCNKRVGLTGFSCRCGNLYCNLHRYSDKHNCSYDYKSAGRDAISKANPVVKADKIDKI